jgi:hypothetical protein
MRAALGTIAILWGGAVLASGLLDPAASPDAATRVGELLALAFGGLLLAAGTRALLRARRPSTRSR